MLCNYTTEAAELIGRLIATTLSQRELSLSLAKVQQLEIFQHQRRRLALV